MDLDTARSAKADVFEKAFGYKAVSSASFDGSNTPLFAQSDEQFEQSLKGGRPLAHQMISVGIARSRDNGKSGDFELVIYCQKKALLNHPIVERARRVVRAEASVVYSGPFRRHVAPERPLRPGVSIGHYRVTAGTLGCFVQLPDKAGVAMLSNNHVLADTNKGKYGEVVLQPGRRDGGTRDAHVAGILHSFVPIDFGSGAVNYVDCAVATLAPGTGCAPDGFSVQLPANLSMMTGEVNEDVFDGDQVYKVGRTTGLTTGTIVSAEQDNLWVNYSTPFRSQLARFDRQMTVQNDKSHFSKPGDSGSLIIDGQGRACGLLFAGSSDGITSANPIRSVLDALSCDIHMA